MAVFNAVNPVNVGVATKKDHFDRVFDNTLALQEGSVALTKVTIDGAAVDPALSPAGDAVLYFNSTANELRLSRSGGAYASVDVFPPNNPLLVGGSRFSGSSFGSW